MPASYRDVPRAVLERRLASAEAEVEALRASEGLRDELEDSLSHESSRARARMQTNAELRGENRELRERVEELNEGFAQERQALHAESRELRERVEQLVATQAPTEELEALGRERDALRAERRALRSQRRALEDERGKPGTEQQLREELLLTKAELRRLDWLHAKRNRISQEELLDGRWIVTAVLLALSALGGFVCGAH